MSERASRGDEPESPAHVAARELAGRPVGDEPADGEQPAGEEGEEDEEEADRVERVGHVVGGEDDGDRVERVGRCDDGLGRDGGGLEDGHARGEKGGSGVEQGEQGRKQVSMGRRSEGGEDGGPAACAGCVGARRAGAPQARLVAPAWSGPRPGSVVPHPKRIIAGSRASARPDETHTRPRLEGRASDQVGESAQSSFRAPRSAFVGRSIREHGEGGPSLSAAACASVVASESREAKSRVDPASSISRRARPRISTFDTMSTLGSSLRRRLVKGSDRAYGLDVARDDRRWTFDRCLSKCWKKGLLKADVGRQSLRRQSGEVGSILSCAAFDLFSAVAA